MEDYFAKDVSPRFTSIIAIIGLLIFLPLMLFAAKQTAELVSRASGTPAKIVVDAQGNLGPISTNFYHAFAQGGEATPTNMLENIVSETKALRPRVIRLDHLYDKYNVVGKNGSDLTYDFSKLDQIVDSVRATGAVPMLALGFMPSAIAKDGKIINPPNNWDEWAQVVQRTVEHYSGKGEKNLSGVYYEVWNEPDLDQFGSWKLSGEKNYITLYHYASVGANNAKGVNTFYLGGPATTGLYKSWIISLIGSGNRVNFLSWHTYQQDPKRFDQDQRNIISWLLPYPNYTLIPKMITEFGFTGSHSILYGKTYASAFTAAVARQLISGGPTYAFSFELIDGPGQSAGDGWGLLTNEDNGKKPKPRYYVYWFLDNMAGDRAALTGEGSWVTGFASTRDKVLRILLVNFDTNGSHTENVPITINNLEPGEYDYRQRFLFGSDVKFHEAVTGSLSKELYMPAQTVALIEITKTAASAQTQPPTTPTPTLQ